VSLFDVQYPRKGASNSVKPTYTDMLLYSHNFTYYH